MGGILEEFYYGNVDPNERAIQVNSKLDKALRQMSAIEEQLLNVLCEEEKELYTAYIDFANQAESASSLDGFLVGFRLGAKFTYDTFVSEQTPYYSDSSEH